MAPMYPGEILQEENLWTTNMNQQRTERNSGTASLFDLDGTLVDSVYQHVVAWREALERSGIELAIWRIH